jgi:hypothetical protein
MIITVYNQHPNIELESPVYFCNRGKHYKHHVERTDAGTIMNIDLKFDIDQNELGGILIYEVRKGESIRLDYQSIINIMAAKIIEEATKMMRFLITWRIKRFGQPKVNTMLIDCAEESVLDEDKLAQFYDKMDFSLSRYCGRRWLMYDNTILREEYDVIQEEGIELKVNISQEAEDEDTIRPMWIDSTRQVSPLMAIYLC